MPEIKNTFLKGRMNQDLDSRILPEGEYREAINLLISRSEGSTVGEFENVLGNSLVGTLSANKKTSVIGSFADETNNKVYLFATDFSNSDASSRAATTNTCFIIEFDLDNPASPVVLVNGYWLNFNKKFPIYGVNLLEELLFWTDDFNQPRKINVTTARNNPTAYTEEMQISVAKYYPCLPVIPVEKTKGLVSSSATNSTTVIVLHGSSASPNIKVGDIVTDFDQTDVTGLQITNTLPPVRVVECMNPGTNTQFRVSPAMAIPSSGTRLPTGTTIAFTRTSMKNSGNPFVSNYSLQEINFVGGTTSFSINRSGNGPAVELGGVPRVGDIITITSGATDDIPNLNNTNAAYRYPIRVSAVTVTNVSNTSTGRWQITTDKDFTAGGNLNGFAVGDNIAIGNNENYDASFKGDTKFLEDKFVRFSYRFKFNDNEYSLMAPFSNVMFVPKQQSQFNLGQIDTKVNDINNYYQDETDAYTSTIIEWFENDVDTIDVKIPLPDTISNLINKYKIQKIDVLYKESDGLAVKVLDTIDLSTPNLTLQTIEYNNDINGLVDQKYYNYNYKSNKPYKTLPQNQTTRVYDKVPIRALAQEVSSNRIIYGNFVEKMTPPSTIPYSVSYGDKDMESSDYAAIYPHQTVKQNRTYQVGFVLVDYYGRQSDVILSSYDSDNTKAGSSVYVPYRAIGEATTTPIINWLGNTLKLNIDSSFGENKNFESGEPGLYREHGYAESIIAITDSDSGYEANTSYKTSGGSGSGCVVRVTSVGGSGEITGLTIINAGSGYTQGDELRVTGGDGAGDFTINTGIANPLGWYSYKVVVKQQQQEYYNVYLPGFVNGLPIQNQTWNGATTGLSPASFNPIETQRGKIFFSTVLSENINKIPRNLSEVGPTDREFNSDEVIYIRVNNPNATKDQQVRNLQYYPSQISQNVLNLSTVKETELAAVPFQPFRTGYTIYSINVGPTGNQGDYGGVSNYNTDGTDANATQSAGRIPYGDVGDKQSFYAADQNPFIMKVGQVENFGNPIGAIVCGKGEGAASGGNYPIPHDTNWNSSTATIPGTPSQNVRNMEPILSIAETKPVYSVLELFYETAMTGKLETLNGMIDTNYNGAVRINANSGSFSESIASGENVGPQFKFINGSGAIIPYASIVGTPVITKVYRQNDGSQTNVPGLFSLVQTTNDQYSIRTSTTFWYGTSSNANPSSDVYIFDIQVTSGTSPQYTDDLTTALTISLSNAAPKMYSDSGLSSEITNSYEVTPNPAVNATNIVQLYGVNGSANTTNRGEQLVWAIASLAPGSGGTVSDFSISSTGLITSNATMTNEGSYGLVVNLIDVNNTGSNKISISRTITWTAGTAYAPKAIGSGQVAPVTQYNMAGTGNSGEYIFADVPDNYIADGSGSPFGSAASSVFNIKKLYNNSTQGNQACSGNATADLFQGTIKITPKLFNTTTAAGDINVLFSIQHRSNSSSSWSSINSVSGGGLDVWTASTSTVQLTKSTGSAGSVSKNYRFDQLGEYRVLTNGLGGDQSTHAKFEVEFQDGAYGITTAGPCQE